MSYLKNFICFFVIVTTTHFAFADSLPVRKIRLSIVHLAETSHGRELMSNFEGDGNFGPLFNSTSFAQLSEKYLYSQNTMGYESIEIYLNSQYMVAPFQYHSWSLAMALFDSKIDMMAMRYDIRSVPQFFELSVWKMAKSIMAWDELNTTAESDFCNDPQFGNLPQAYNSCPSRFSDLWNNNRQRFQSAVERRNLKIGIPHLSLKDAADKATGDQKKLYQELYQAYQLFADKYLPNNH